MFDDFDNELPENLELSAQFKSLLDQADAATQAGEHAIAAHLLIAAFEQATSESEIPSEDAINALKQAWALAYVNRERSLAEHIYTRLEPFLSVDEMQGCAMQLQDLAFLKLEELGVSRDELIGMSNFINNNMIQGILPIIPTPSAQPQAAVAEDVAEDEAAADEQPFDQAEYERIQADSAEGAQVEDAAADDQEQPAQPETSSDNQPAAAQPTPNQRIHLQMPEFNPADLLPGKTVSQVPATDLSRQMRAPFDGDKYKDLVGYDVAIELMGRFGIGTSSDEDFKMLVSFLNAQHGVDRMPAPDAMIFRAIAREDANKFMSATVREIGLPVLRMRIDENMQGAPVLCVMTQTDNAPKLNRAKNAFAGPGILVIEDLDMWVAPNLDPNEQQPGVNPLLAAQATRGARETVNLIRSAVDNPEVYVLASMQVGEEVDPFFCDLLEPFTVVDIESPTPDERRAIWMDLMQEHPSLAVLDVDELVRYSDTMPRADIYFAVREAIEQAYKEGLYQRKYIPVTRDLMLEKIAAFQPLDSAEYRALEDAVVADFLADLERSMGSDDER